MNSEVKYHWPLNSGGLGRPILHSRKWVCNFWLPRNVPTVLRSMGDSIQGPRRYQNPGMLTSPEGNGVELYLQSALLIHGFPTTIENTFPPGIDGIWRCKRGCGRMAVCVLAKSLSCMNGPTKFKPMPKGQLHVTVAGGRQQYMDLGCCQVVCFCCGRW